MSSHENTSDRAVSVDSSQAKHGREGVYNFMKSAGKKMRDYLTARSPLDSYIESVRGLEARELDFSGDVDLKNLPDGLKVRGLNLSGCAGLQSLPQGLEVEGKLVITGCVSLSELPDYLKAGVLDMQGCTNIPELPASIECQIIDLRGCDNIRIPQSLVELDTACGVIEFPENYEVTIDDPAMQNPSP